jgi:SAM-dependent methyltransferase/glycosyltransferase involved in cell wall biosynthesis
MDIGAAVAPSPAFEFFLGGHSLMISMRRMSSASTPSGVWILDDGLIMGGGQRFGLRLAEAFADLSLPTRFLSPADSEFGREAVRHGFEVVDISYPRLIPPAVTLMPDTMLRLREQFEAAPPGTMVIGNTARCQAYATAALVTVRQWPVLVHLMHEQNSAARPSARAVYRRIGALVAVGDQTADLYRQRLPGVEIDAVSNFLGEAEVRRVMGTRTPPPDGPRPIIGMLGRMIPEKGVLEMVEELAQSRDAWETVKIGAPAQDTGYADRVRDRIADLGLEDRIELLGQVGDLDAFFASIDVLVVPSIGREAQPTVILEGLLYGRPVLLREPLRSSQLDDLPVAYYATPAELRAHLQSPPEGTTSPEEFLARFGASDVVDTILRVAADELDGGPRGYFDWHDEPGYYRDIIDHFSPTDRLLDVGCGTAWLQDHFPDYAGIDLSVEAVEHARARGRNAMVHDVEKPLPFPDDSFDAVIVKDLLEHVLDPVGVVQEIGRVLRPGGLVFASSPDAQRWVWDDYTHRRPYTLTGYRRLFRDQGFSVAKSGYESVMPGIGIVSGLTRSHHRPKPLAALARMRLVRRNVWVLGRWG